MAKKSRPHLSVMLQEFLDFFSENQIKTFFEGTLGAGGHAEKLLESHPEIKTYIGCDRDPVALELAEKQLAPWKKKLVLVEGDFADIDEILKEKKVKSIDGCFFDLGVSSMQLDQGERGFSFSKEGPLDMRMGDMRMGRSSALNAEEIVNKWTEKKLGDIFREYGEEPRWRKAAKAIIDARRKKPIKTTLELADVIINSIGRSRKKLHPATLVFQALRICVNNELGALKDGLSKAIEKLSSGGRLGVISFHRLEDRIVKEMFKEAYQNKTLKILTKKPLVPTSQEIKINPRSRSAKMRFAEKI
ncbi:MAG: 16S rRNA (cytosine(1402)-N(4))-methyltransferase RsmH [Chlamydiota bacterium]